MSVEFPEDLQEAIRFHGHVCPGLVMGYRAARAARDYLQVERPEDEELVAVAESDGCGVDAVQSLLGCTLGKGNLIYLDRGKQAYTLICRKKGRAVRVAARPGLFDRTPEQEAAFQKVMSGTATEEEKAVFQAFQKERLEWMLQAGTEDLFTLTEVSPEVPGKARIFKSVTCQYCGEPVMEPRARIRDGKVACLDCCEHYGRGW